jgi:H+/Cl- antiporter ClcA
VITFELPFFWFLVLIVVVSSVCGAFGHWLIEKLYWWWRELKARMKARKVKKERNNARNQD